MAPQTWHFSRGRGVVPHRGRQREPRLRCQGQGRCRRWRVRQAAGDPLRQGATNDLIRGSWCKGATNQDWEYTILYFTILSYTILYYTNTLLYYYLTIHYYTILFFILYFTRLYFTVLYYTIIIYTICGSRIPSIPGQT